MLDVTTLRFLGQISPPMPNVIEAQAVRSSPRSKVHRLRLAASWKGHDRLVLKQAVDSGAEERFGRELAALRLLSALDIDAPVAPKLLGWDKPGQLLLLEDLGDGGLAAMLSGYDGAAAEAALLAYATSLGRLHAGTAGLESGLTNGAVPSYTVHLRNIRLPCDGTEFRRLCEASGVSVDPMFDEEVRRVEAILSAPGPFQVLTHGDPCPGNERLTDRGIVFFDFEASSFDHALLDAAYLTMAFPTCWCVGAIPPKSLAEAQAMYRRVLASRIPEAADDMTFSRHLLHASARWLLTGDAIVPCAERGDRDRLVALLTSDWQWGPSTARQRLLYRLEAFTRLAQTVDELNGLAATASRLYYALVAKWPLNVRNLGQFAAFSSS